jgi:hypothetical protein
MHPGELAEMQLLTDLAKSIREAPRGQRGALAQRGADTLGISVQTLYTRLRRVGFQSGRRLRSDKGDSRVGEHAVRDVAALLQASRRTTGKALLSVNDAIDIARANGLLKEEVSAATMQRLMRRHGCHPAQLARPDPHVSMRSLHPNHVWQLDASVCVLYYLRNGSAAVMDERKFNARKPADLAKVNNRRVLRYALTDHYSGAVTARYYNVAGEDQRTLFDFLMWAMHPQGERVMHGVPWMMVWDAGSANQSHGIGNLLTALGVRHWAHVPGNPRAKGQVETTHNIIERSFEGRLTFTKTDSIEQLNGHLDTWLRSFNGARAMRRHGHTRDALWQTIRTEQLRLCPPAEACSVLMHSKPEPRTVAGNLTISYKARGHDRATYSVADVPNVRVGERVEVLVNPYRAPAIYVVGYEADGSVRYYECEPVARDAAGFFSEAPAFGERFAAAPDTDVDAARKTANERAFGERETLDALDKKAKGAVAFGGEVDPFADLREKAERTPSYLQRRGTELHLPNPVHIELKPLDLVEVLFELRARFGRALEQREREAVQAWFPDGVEPDELDGLVARLQQLSAAGSPPVFDEAPRLVAIK